MTGKPLVKTNLPIPITIGGHRARGVLGVPPPQTAADCHVTTETEDTLAGASHAAAVHAATGYGVGALIRTITTAQCPILFR